MFDRLFHLTRGGVSKASKVINLSEDIFAGHILTLAEDELSLSSTGWLAFVLSFADEVLVFGI